MPACTRAARWRISTPTRSAASARWCSEPTPACLPAMAAALGTCGAGALPCALFGAGAHLSLLHSQSAGARPRAGDAAASPSSTSRWRCEPMQAAAQLLVGTHDFSAFRAARVPGANRPCATSCSCAVQRAGDFVLLEVTANAFLHHMVRNIAGLLIHVGARRGRPRRWRCRGAGRPRPPPGARHRAGRRPVPVAGALPAGIRTAGRFRYHAVCPSGCPADLMDS